MAWYLCSFWSLQTAYRPRYQQASVHCAVISRWARRVQVTPRAGAAAWRHLPVLRRTIGRRGLPCGALLTRDRGTLPPATRFQSRHAKQGNACTATVLRRSGLEDTQTAAHMGHHTSKPGPARWPPPQPIQCTASSFIFHSTILHTLMGFDTLSSLMAC